ncbi:alpha-amylase family glycosyl hydrolase [soil metagenome]
MTEFHVSRAARDRYSFDEGLFSMSGNVVLADFAASRRFVQKMNAQRDLQADPGLAVRAGDLNAMGLIDEILHHVVELYRRQVDPRAMSRALGALEDRLGRDVLDATLQTFVEHFPASAVYRGEADPKTYLRDATDGVSNRELALEELLLLWLANGNPGYAPFGELFDDTPLGEGSSYEAVLRGVANHFATQPPFGPDGDDLITLLRRPAVEAATLAAQLSWLRRHWGLLIERFGDRLMVSLDVISEEERAEWMRFHATHGGGDDGGQDTADTSALHSFDGLDAETERFSADSDWMPRHVLLAKSTYVWLDQLARTYGRPVWRLDQIPDEELDRLAQAGFSGLWLIGLWERSHASQRIKQLRGNPEAVASAYSLMDYRISEDLGGEEGYRDLRERAWARGLRLASDMVPNHMGIDSRWVIEHPEWFMSRPDPPYPAYTYNGPNLSSDERVGIYLEDHYYDNTDAAVTFKRVDRWSDEARYIYHGNDGTAMPWNDTSQLDYVKPEVREAVIQTILHVARLFPVIRFDAAMTLAKKHIQRLWYPEPGSGGAIPSRAEYSTTKRDFDSAMPVEFWREVVDRVAAEAPDTLLLAEAFWLMEGYFVRTLGMHRVYNSAFMNMLRDEKNAEYRMVMKNTLDFDPQILKRYVNFMNNPDERTAIDQFGNGDKYFGVCTLMVTLPGLPMFGHGQVEGFGERYGMEYRRAKLEEQPDGELIARHEREIFPLLHRRELFAEVDQFALYDFETADGVNEDVFAYSNQHALDRTLVVYHNRYGDTRGWIRWSVGAERRSLADGLSLLGDDTRYLLLRDERSGLEFLHSQRELAADGLYLELGAYACHVFLELREIDDVDGQYGRLCAWLGGRGVPSVEHARVQMELQPLHDGLRRALEPGLLTGEAPATFGSRLSELLATAGALAGAADAANDDALVAEAVAGLTLSRPLATYLAAEFNDPSTSRAIHAAWLMVRAVDRSLGGERAGVERGQWIEDWRAGPVIDASLAALGVEQASAGRVGDLLAALLAADGVADWLSVEQVRRAIGVNEHAGTTWFDRDGFSELVAWLQVPDLARTENRQAAGSARRRVAALCAAAEQTGYRVDRLAQALAAGAPAARRARPPRPARPARRKTTGQ